MSYENNHYELLNKDTVIATFDIEGEGIREQAVNVNILQTLPFWIKSITGWITNRSAAKHRRFVKDLLKEMQAETMSGFIALTNCLSLQDTLWVRSADSPLTWGQVNLFENDFSEVMTHLAFDGTGLYGKKIRTTSPELTTDGAYDKCWIRRDGRTLLLKSGSTGARNAGLEPYSEVMASKFYVEFCKGTDYNLEHYRGHTVAVCESFSDIENGYKPISLYLEDDSTLDALLRTIESNNCSTDMFCRILVADSVMVNCDRHLGNFGFLVRNDDYSVASLAPAFDYNKALTPFAESKDDIDDFKDYDKYLLDRGPSIGGEYVELAKAVLTPEMKSDLVNLKDMVLSLPDWAYDDSESYHFTRQRTEILNEVKNVQIDRILGEEKRFSFAD